jgi:serine/threonine-protein kinase
VVSPGITLPDRYQPLRKIARGGMATVWCAHDRVLDRRVAIKLLAEPFAHDELAGRRFTREARAAARLSGHANVVTIYDVGRAPADDTPFIVMEYLSGGTVADALRTGEVDPELTVRWLHEAAAALDYAHRRGVIHRDVKLSNFLLDRDRELHVADFGIAQLGSEDTLSTSGQVLGTAGYLAPERALGLPATEASDRYALAVAAFELLVGARPFTSEHFTAQARQHVEEPPPRASTRNPALPPAIDAVLAKGMSKHQEERFGTSRQLVDAIEGALIGRAPARRAAEAPPPPQRVPPTTPVSVYGGRGRGRLAALAALAAVIFGVAIAAGATILRSPSHSQAAARTHATYAQHKVATPASHPPAQQHTATTPPKQPTPAPQTTPVQPPPPTAVTLEAQGHSLMLGGQYHGAIPVLRQAVAAAPHSSLTYAYALYDLGHSLRLAGDPRAAVTVLWQRLQIPNQTDVVRNELALALEALGQSQAGSNLTASNQNAQPDGHGRHHGASGGAAPGPGSQGD